MAEAHQGQGAHCEYEDPQSFTACVGENQITMLPGGQDRLEALLALIDQAQTSLKLCFYIYACDETGARVRDALVEAARRGVAVTVILDGFGAVADEAFFADLTAAGGEFVCFIANWTRRYLIRNHQKIVISDDRVAMLGGFNIENDYFAPPTGEAWADLGFTIEGPVVGRVVEWYRQLRDWTANPGSQFRAIRRMVRRWEAGSGPVQLLIGGPSKGMSGWARCVSSDLAEGSRLDMIMGYFSPPRGLQQRICKISAKGGTRLVFAGKSDNAATIGASRALYQRFLESGAQLYEFDQCKLHTKLIVLDDAVYVGSANFDMRSLFLNLEIVLRIEDAAFAAQMRELFAAYLPGSQEVTSDLHRERSSISNRIRWTLSWFLVAVADYTVSRRLNLGLR